LEADDPNPVEAAPMTAPPDADQWFTVPGDRLRELADAAISAAAIRPGDVLIVGLAGPITRAQAATLKTEITARLPGLADVLIMDRVAALATYRPEAVTDAPH
jgi:hypothetical protein